MPNREYEPVRREDGNQGFRGRDERERDERELGMRDERWGQGQGWQGRGPERGGWAGDERERWSAERYGRSSDERMRNPSGMGGYDRFAGMERGFGGFGGYGRDPYASGGGYRAREGMHPGPYGNQELGWEPRGWGHDFRGGPPWERGRMQGRAPRSYVRSDERIKEDLCDRLMQSWIDAENVEVQVTRGEVVLSGTVDERAAKRAIEDLAEQILGVKDVQNQIRVQERRDEMSGSSTSGTGTARKPSA